MSENEEESTRGREGQGSVSEKAIIRPSLKIRNPRIESLGKLGECPGEGAPSSPTRFALERAQRRDHAEHRFRVSDTPDPIVGLT